MLAFILLGEVVLQKNGVPLTQFRSQKEAALLVYLAQTGQTYQRDFIAELLWHGRTTQQSRKNLRTALTRLRKQVGEALLVTRKTLALSSESYQVDARFLLKTLASVGQVDTLTKASTLQKAVATYHGDFLPDFDLPDAPEFNAWVMATRATIRSQVIAAYQKLGQYMLSTGDVENGIPIARQWLQVDELDEAAHTLLIRLLLKKGNGREAVAHYDKCTQMLRSELGIDPPAEMTALIQDVRLKRAISSKPHQKTAVLHNLPAQYDQFFGRKAVQQAIHVRLDQPWCRLVTITGQGGVGKTRLATTIARSRLSQYPDGVWLVDLTHIDPHDDDLVEAIAVEIATILDLRLTGATPPMAQLLTHLQHKQLLLVLDNFEHLLAGIQIVGDIAQRCANVQLLVTSREALKLKAEWTIALTGLSYPTSDIDAPLSDAVEMFAARRAQQQRGAISTSELAAISTICRLVEGLPLAIELAAALTRQATAQAVADSLQAGFETLTASHHDVPQRHHNLHIVFEMSWRTLSPTLQQSLARLSRFRSGFTTAAALQIADANDQHLAALAEKSLLTYHTVFERYTLHPVIRAYAAAKRPAGDPTPQKHAHYYLTLLAQHAAPLQKNRPQDSIHVLEPDSDNVRLAWQAGLDQHDADLLYDALSSLSIYYQLRGLAHEAEAVMHTTFNTAVTWKADGLALATRAGLERARFQNRLGRYRPAIQTLNTALKLAEQGADQWAQGMAHVLWGEALWRLGQYDLATNKLNHALTIAHALDATLIVGWCHHHLGIIDDIQSRYDSALDHLQQACSAWRALDNAQTLSNSLNSVGLVRYHQGDLPAAQQAMEQALTLCNQLDNRHLQSQLLNNLSIISTEQNDYMGAQYYLQLGLDLATTSGNLTTQGEIYTNLGRNYLLRGESVSAIESLEQGLQISESLGNRSLMATAMLNLANTNREQRDAEQAESWYIQALKIAQQDDLQHTECEILINLAELLSKNNTKQAKQYSVQAVTRAKTIQNPNLLKRAQTIDNYLDVSANVNAKNLSV